MADLTALPESLKVSPQQYLEQFRSDVLEKSQGRLFDFSPSSVLTILGEAQALSISKLISSQIEFLDYLKADVIESLGFTRLEGRNAVCTVRFQLTNPFDRDFVIPRGYRFSLSNERVFATDSDLIIPANTDTSNPAYYEYCTVNATAIATGISGNQQAQKANILQQILEVDSIWLDEPSRNGQDEESPDLFFSRVSTTIAKFLESQYSLVQPSEFEKAVISILGKGSTAIAIPDISADGNSVLVASMNVFAANSDGTALTNAQIADLSNAISEQSPLVKGRLFFSSLIIPKVNISLSVKIPPSAVFDSIASEINTSLRSTFSVSETAKMESLELYEAIFQIKLTGALNPIVTWAYDAPNSIYHARNLPLPKLANASDKTSPVTIGKITITLEPSGLVKEFLNA